MHDAMVGAVLFLVGTSGSALCSGLETGFYCVSSLRLRVRLGSPGVDRQAVLVKQELDSPDRLLTTLLIWNNVFNYLSSLGLAAVMLAWGVHEGLVIAFQALVLTPVLLVLGESLPKEVFRVRADELPYRLIGLVRLARLAAMPVLPMVLGFARLVVRVTGGASSASGRGNLIAALLKESALHGAISSVQALLIDRALELTRTPVVRYARPLEGTLIDPSDRAAVSRESKKWAPEPLVVLRARNKVKGIVDPLANPDDPLAVSEPVRIEAATSVRDALARLAAAGARLGVVTEGDRDIGIVTMRALTQPLMEALRREERAK